MHPLHLLWTDRSTRRHSLQKGTLSFFRWMNSLAVKTCEIENEFHFLVKCKQYDQLRNVLFSRLSCPEFDQLNDQNKFCYMLTRTHVARIVGQFIIDAFDNRPVKI